MSCCLLLRSLLLFLYFQIDTKKEVGLGTKKVLKHKDRFRGHYLGDWSTPSKILPWVSWEASRSCSTGTIAFYTYAWAIIDGKSKENSYSYLRIGMKGLKLSFKNQNTLIEQSTTLIEHPSV